MRVSPADPPKPPYGVQQDYQVLEGMEDAILVLDEDARIIWANAASHRMLGYEPGWAGKVSALADRILTASGSETLEFEIGRASCRERV